jgi:FKBP-type peptidyl-prolyl cis-trans isomerase
LIDFLLVLTQETVSITAQRRMIPGWHEGILLQNNGLDAILIAPSATA